MNCLSKAYEWKSLPFETRRSDGPDEKETLLRSVAAPFGLSSFFSTDLFLVWEVDGNSSSPVFCSGLITSSLLSLVASLPILQFSTSSFVLASKMLSCVTGTDSTPIVAITNQYVVSIANSIHLYYQFNSI